MNYPAPVLYYRRAKWYRHRLDMSEGCDAAIKHTWSLCNHGLLSWGTARRHDKRIRRKRVALQMEGAR